MEMTLVLLSHLGRQLLLGEMVLVHPSHLGHQLLLELLLEMDLEILEPQLLLELPPVMVPEILELPVLRLILGDLWVKILEILELPVLLLPLLVPVPGTLVVLVHPDLQLLLVFQDSLYRQDYLLCYLATELPLLRHRLIILLSF